MEQHPIPRQITTFEFKLIGFLTLRQFLYLAVSFPVAFIVYKLFPLPILNALFAAVVGGIGLALAFLPINDRPLDVWIRNLLKRLTSPTQYVYRKHGSPINFLRNLIFLSDPHRVLTHVESQEKLAAYLSKTQKPTSTDEKKQSILSLLQNPGDLFVQKRVVPVQPSSQQIPEVVAPPTAPRSGVKKPFFSGIVKNHKLIPLPGILIYIRDEKGEVVRLLKTNPYGVFATFNPLPPGTYSFEIKDLKNAYVFDTMKLPITETNPKPLEFFSKELL